MTCLHCGARVDSGLVLCDLCQRYAHDVLEYLPLYFRNLARWTPGRAGSRQVPGSRVLYDGEPRRSGDRIGVALDEVFNALGTSARMLADARPYLARLLNRLSRAHDEDRVDDAEAVAWLCAGFDRYLASLSTLDWCGEFVRELGQHEARLRRLTEAAIPGWYAGACTRCGVTTHVMPGRTWVTCTGCGNTTHAGDHIDVILDEARGWVARPKPLAEAVVALVHTEESVPRLYERIKKWEQRDQLDSVQRTAREYAYDEDTDRIVVVVERVGAKRYRLGDVLDLVYREATRGRRGARVKVAAS